TPLLKLADQCKPAGFARKQAAERKIVPLEPGSIFASQDILNRVEQSTRYERLMLSQVRFLPRPDVNEPEVKRVAKDDGQSLLIDSLANEITQPDFIKVLTQCFERVSSGGVQFKSFPDERPLYRVAGF